MFVIPICKQQPRRSYHCPFCNTVWVPSLHSYMFVVFVCLYVGSCLLFLCLFVCHYIWISCLLSVVCKFVVCLFCVVFLLKTFVCRCFPFGQYDVCILTLQTIRRSFVYYCYAVLFGFSLWTVTCSYFLIVCILGLVSFACMLLHISHVFVVWCFFLQYVVPVLCFCLRTSVWLLCCLLVNMMFVFSYCKQPRGSYHYSFCGIVWILILHNYLFVFLVIFLCVALLLHKKYLFVVCRL